ncbi:MAG TPA: bifunctional phosphoribosylaminoimidazolecarboxamide formyltransferase/IMP cyclohydrolase, partial [Bdellovibrionota bacterium]|nr:bifunctional phosphoribosylaminoimidazolecarboxamide formyltransferase/IMP cyclohydrolase [Bdellovibrionota bacterium]
FLEVVIAPRFEEDALELLKSKKNLRLLSFGEGIRRPQQWDLRRIGGGLLIQEMDNAMVEVSSLPAVTERKPTGEELKSLEFAWKVVKHVKSNAIVFAKDGRLIGVGAGQMSRVDAVKVAKMKAQLPLGQSVAASDAFFPFRDGIDEIAKAGATAVIQPGGSRRDEEVIRAANEHGLAMIFTHMRHFKH